MTDESGTIREHMEYTPWGETWLEQLKENADLNQAIKIPNYLFTSKELDATGLYYFGARYYDPQTSVWQSTDPIFENYLNGEVNNGVYNSFNFGLYTYSYQCPVQLEDPDGNSPIITGGIGAAIAMTAYAIRSAYVGDETTSEGLGKAALAGFVFGSGAALIPAAGAVLAAGLTGYSAGNVAMRAADYEKLSEKGKRELIADGVLTGASALATGYAGSKIGKIPSDANNSATAGKLNASLASEEGYSKVMSGGGTEIAGKGANVPIKDINRITSQYGGIGKDWSKVVGPNRSIFGNRSIETHAYENKVLKIVVEPKTKITK